MKTNIFFVSLGCDKNKVDSEEMLAYLDAAGFSFVDDEYEAEVIVINTCCFIDDAKEESIETILEMARMKEEGKCKRLVVAGCLSERYKDELIKELPEVDAYIGTGNLKEIVDAVKVEAEHVTQDFKETAEHEKPNCKEAAEHVKTNCKEVAEHVPYKKRIITTGGHYEFLKIAEGCNKRCTYCIIPYIRGSYKSTPMDELINESKYLAGEGVKELIVVAQETSIYGKDLYGEDKLSELLKELCKIDGFKWIRVLYCYPEDVTKEFLEVMASEPKICNYIDMPIQHSSDNVLRKMGRRTNHDSIVQKIKLAREIVPDVVLRTSLIAGFPGESEEDFENLREFISDVKFDHLGVFTYSQEEGTPAANFDGQIDDEIKVARRNKLMEIQEEISYNNLQSKIGKTFDVFIEGKLADEDAYVGRTYMDAPDVDSYFYVKYNGTLHTGDFVKVKVVSNSQYDLYGELI